MRVDRSLKLPEGIGRNIHQNRALKMAREGAQMTEVLAFTPAEPGMER